MKNLILAAAALSLAACASPPGRIKPIPNAGVCTEADRARLAAISKEQASAAVADAVGVFVVLVPVASLGGGDHEGEIAVLKGRCGEPTKKKS